jgi:hypothetical protein
VNGPFETEHQARQSPAVRVAYGMWSPGLGSLTGANHEMLCTACASAGVELGAYDHRILQWLAGFEPQTCAVIAGIISRAAAADVSPAVLPGNYDVTSDEVSLVLDALDVAADHKRDAADICSDCDGYPDGELCGTCEHRLRMADEYEQLAERIRGAR